MALILIFLGICTYVTADEILTIFVLSNLTRTANLWLAPLMSRDTIFGSNNHKVKII